MNHFITQTELATKISTDNNLVVLDARAELMDSSAGWNQYKTSHIKSAQFVSMEDTLTGKIRTHGGRHPLPNMENFITAMKKVGMNDSSMVVIYDDGNLAMAGRLWWLLKYAGKDNVYLLEGGMKKWLENKLEVTNVLKEPVTSNSLSLNIKTALLVDVHEVKRAVRSTDTAIIDSRAYERYAGQVEPLDTRPGHIPNALNYPWTDLVNNGQLMNKKELEERFEPLQNYKEVIVHCGSGITGTVNILFMKEVGLNPKLYLGGYSDWVSYADNKVETKN
ncbi:sulfurtransferase [Carnobacterium funditum]|uniref:sulfurtransferase n=1 Tax=Carnobacterium funditum TaxID=2752 RepID=UPI00054FCBBE|nr:sulfurtransferase [Carnobacterium funditum]